MIGSGASGTGTGLKLLLIGLGRGCGLKHQKEKRSMNHFACRRRGGASGDPRPSSLLKKDKACSRPKPHPGAPRQIEASCNRN
jgi:hypothetical protein